LKYESVVKGSGGRGGAAPVDLVANMLKSRIPTYTFVNRHQDYPETAEDFKNDTKNYEAMYNKLKSKISGTKDYSEFRSRILSMYRSNNKKSMAVAQSKLMQLNFFFDVLSANRNKPEEFWTDLLYLSLKVGKRFAPHGKLA
jgi:transposase-like protein